MYAFIFVPDFPMCTVTACHTFLGTHFDRVEWLAGVSAVSTTWRVDATTTARIIWNWRYLILEYFELEWNKKQVFSRAELFKMEKLGWKQKEIETGWYRVSWATILTDELIIFKDKESCIDSEQSWKRTAFQFSFPDERLELLGARLVITSYGSAFAMLFTVRTLTNISHTVLEVRLHRNLKIRRPVW